MKKFMKGCAITALIMIVLGIVMAAAAGTVRGSEVIAQVVERATGGKVHANLGLGMFKNGSWGIFVDDDDWDNDDWDDDDWDDDDWDYSGSGHHGEDASRSSLPGTGQSASESGSLNSSRDSGSAAGTGEFTPEQVRELDIEVGGCSFEILPSETGLFYLESQGAGNVRFYLEGDELHVESWNTKVVSGPWTESIQLYVPENCVSREINGELGAGELSLSNLEADEVSLEVGAGAIQAERLYARETDVSVGVGRLELYDMDTQILEGEVGMGELAVSGDIDRSGKLECSMGNLNIKLDGDEKDFNYRLEAEAGTIDLNGSRYSGFSRERRIDNGAAKDLEIECSVGNVSVQFTE